MKLVYNMEVIQAALNVYTSMMNAIYHKYAAIVLVFLNLINKMADKQSL
jgi:hypothetical protein